KRTSSLDILSSKRAPQGYYKPTRARTASLLVSIPVKFHDPQRWTREQAPPYLSKATFAAFKLNDSRWDSDYKKLWKPPPNHGFLPCTKPTPNYTTYPESRGYKW
ncbi:hypothetical protein S245_051728, partial [Arachis hypogaea]